LQGIWLGYLAFVLYGSFVPFDFHPAPIEDALSQFKEVCSQPIRIESRSDWTANFALFVPLGFLLMACFSVDRKRWVGITVAPIVVLACVLLTTSIEFFQLFFPSRVSSVQDIAAESVGGIAGTLIWIVAGQRIIKWARDAWDSVDLQGLAGRLLPGYLVFLILVNIVPLDLTLSPVELYHKYKNGRIRINPVAPHPAPSYEVAKKHIWTFIYFMPLGVLLSLLPKKNWQGNRAWRLVLLFGFASALLVEFLKLFVLSRYADTANVIMGTIAVMAGWALVRTHRLGSQLNQEGGPSKTFPEFGLASVRGLILAAWLIVVIFLNWHPFDFTGGSEFLWSRVQKVALLPFADYFRGPYWNALDQFLQKSLVYFPFGIVLTFCFANRQPGAIERIVLGSALGIALIIEAGQLFLPSRYASITDVLVEIFGAWVGWYVTCRALSIKENGMTLKARAAVSIGRRGIWAS
jgi:VanZ family protein